ncbi:phosphate acetyltransferase [Buchnera aphidicola]|uniref:Phosphate acetyltransferase n=1 Tax=Buchnera aphidicola (Stegophylla sp.) TaxID=2315800 RepID=A0A4D6YA68_9GAMM|nr:phosphate acetyltransferase [Buchnera aphidicola (Stegophylla sp.)]
MKRNIMLIPVSKNINLTIISLGLINFFEELNHSVLFFKPFYELHNCYDVLDDTSLILKKYFSTSFINSHHINKKFFLLEKFKNKYLLENSIDLFLKNKIYYDILLIEGVNNNSHNFLINDLNLDLSYHLKSDLIFVFSHDDYKNIIFFLKKIKNFNISNNFLGIIINNTFLNFQDIYINRVSKHIKSQCIDNIPIIADIRYNCDVLFYPISKILTLLKVHKILKINFNVNVVKLFLFYDNLIFDYEYNYSHSILIISYDIFVHKFIHILKRKLNFFNFYAIILFNVKDCHTLQYGFLKDIKKFNISFFYTLLDINIIKLIINRCHINILKYNQNQLKKLSNYISNCLNEKYIISHTKCNKKKYFSHLSSFSFLYNLKKYAKKLNKCILLPEGNELRIIQSAAIANELGIARCVLLGNVDEIHQIALSNNIILSKNINIINPKNIYFNYVHKLVQLRYKKGMTFELAKSIVYHSNIILGSLMLHVGEIDGIVCGVRYTSIDVLKSALQIIGVNKKKNVSLVSSIFFMLLKNHVLVYGDCSVNINPNFQQLSEIAIQSADLSKKFGIEPRIAMLSYSTGLSGQGESVEKVRQATILIKKNRPDLVVDGPIQYDASVNEFISSIKSPSSPLLGQATVLIFPDLNSGNITYKAIQQSLGVYSIGPILQGLNKPVNDLSRGASIDDIVYTIAVTAIQSDQE